MLDPQLLEARVFQYKVPTLSALKALLDFIHGRYWVQYRLLYVPFIASLCWELGPKSFGIAIKLHRWKPHPLVPS